MKMVSGKIKPHRGIWLSWNLNDTTKNSLWGDNYLDIQMITYIFHEVTYNHISLHQAARGIIQSQKYRSYCYYCYGKSCLKVVFIYWCFCVRQCYLQRTVLQALLWWMFPRWNKGGEMAVWWRDCPQPLRDWPPLSFSSSALSPLSSSFSHPWRILSLRCQQSSAGKTSKFQRPLPLHQDLHLSTFGSTTGSLGFRKLAMLCFRFSREEVANMSVLGRILFTDAVRILSLSWCTNGSSFSAATTTCKQGV